MAEAAVPVSQDQFVCPICLDKLKEPVTTACGHTFCMVCINRCWDQEGEMGDYSSCPQCRHTFTTRPVLKKNVAFIEMMEQMMKMELRAASPARRPAPCAECDVCIGRKHRAIKSCLVCLASYCETHLQPHYQSPTFKTHKLVKATKLLQQQICSQHQKPLEVYCHTDQRGVCYECVMDQHRGHETVTAAAERAKREMELRQMQLKSQQLIQQRERELKEMKMAVEAHKRSAQTAVEDSKMVFNQLIRLIERKRSEVTALIRGQEAAMVKRADVFLKQLEQELAQLRTRASELEQLSQTEDHVQFLQSFGSLSSPTLSAERRSLALGPQQSFSEVAKAVMELRKKLEVFCREEMENVSSRVTRVTFLEPSTRKEFIQYSCVLTLDPNTVHSALRLSEGNRVVSWDDLGYFYPDHPERFEAWPQVLCSESVSGRAYWELEWTGAEGVGVAVAYRSVSRKEDCLSVFGYNVCSWCLSCLPSAYTVWHDSQETTIPRTPSSSSRIGVYVDREAGTLAFFHISNTITLLHRVQTTFVEALHPGFWLGPGSKVILGPCGD